MSDANKKQRIDALEAQLSELEAVLAGHQQADEIYVESLLNMAEYTKQMANTVMKRNLPDIQDLKERVAKLEIKVYHPKNNQ